VIKDFADHNTKKFWDTGKTKGMAHANLRKTAEKKLAILHAAVSLEDLRTPPGNQLEALVGDTRVNTVCGSMTGFGYASYGGIAMPTKLKSPITTNRENA
jgi:plasmid maintenance system killer protein